MGIPLATASVARVVNPLGSRPYAGPKGAIGGVIRMEGDPPPAQTELDLPPECSSASEFYGKLFREGPGRTVADVLVTVTGYDQQYLPARGPDRKLKAFDCHWESRTVALTFGQSLTVLNAGQRPHLPNLVGSLATANLASIPGGDPVELYPMQPGRFLLEDLMNPFMRAEVLVLKYRTFDVTGLDGRYRIDGLPPVEVKVNAYLPQARLVDERTVRVVAGEETRVDFTLRFELARYRSNLAAATSASASAGSQAPARRAP